MLNISKTLISIAEIVTPHGGTELSKVAVSLKKVRNLNIIPFRLMMATSPKYSALFSPHTLRKQDPNLCYSNSLKIINKSVTKEPMNLLSKVRKYMLGNIDYIELLSSSNEKIIQTIEEKIKGSGMVALRGHGIARTNSAYTTHHVVVITDIFICHGRKIALMIDTDDTVENKSCDNEESIRLVDLENMITVARAGAMKFLSDNHMNNTEGLLSISFIHPHLVAEEYRLDPVSKGCITGYLEENWKTGSVCVEYANIGSTLNT